MDFKKTLSFTKQMHLLYISTGFSWLLCGTFSLFSSTPFRILYAVSFLVCVVSTNLVLFSRRQMPDEMARENLFHAKAIAYDIMHIIFCIALIASLFFLKYITDTPDWGTVIPAIFYYTTATKNLITGFAFQRLEAM